MRDTPLVETRISRVCAVANLEVDTLLWRDMRPVRIAANRPILASGNLSWSQMAQGWAKSEISSNHSMKEQHLHVTFAFCEPDKTMMILQTYILSKQI